MTTTSAGRILFALWCGILPVAVTGCGSNQDTTVAAVTPTPVPKFTAAEQKFIATAKNMSPQQQMVFFKKNPDMLKKPAVMNKLFKEMPRVQMQPTTRKGGGPRIPTGRPDL